MLRPRLLASNSSLYTTYKYQSAIGGEKEREILVLYAWYTTVFVVWCVVVIFQYRFNVKILVQRFLLNSLFT